MGPRADLEALEEEMAADAREMAACRELLEGCKATLKDYGNRLEDRYRALDVAKSLTDGKSTTEVVRRIAENAVTQRGYEVIRERNCWETLPDEDGNGKDGKCQGNRMASKGALSTQLTSKATASSTFELAPWASTPVIERYLAGRNFMATLDT